MKTKRIEEIKGWLNAYAQGWISYDRAHVLALQNELAGLSLDGFGKIDSKTHAR